MDIYPFPLQLRLAADPRFVETNLFNDHIWKLTAGLGDPPSLSVETSYGLRAQEMRIFPAFHWRGRTRLDPGEFVEGIGVEALLSNYIRLRFVPFVDLNVTMEYWVVDSQLLAGRISLMNMGNTPEEHRLRLHAQLRPAEGGELMKAQEYAGVDVLQGKTSKLAPVLFLSGGALAERVAYPALSVSQSLPVGEEIRVFWATTADVKPAEGFQKIRSLADSSWEAEIARIELENSGLVRVESGDPGWDAAFARSQQVAHGLMLSGSTYLPRTSFVLNRTPDQGHSSRRDGSDLPETWAGQDVYAAHQLAGQLLPSAPEAVEGFLHNYLHVQAARGDIDGRPGLAGQRLNHTAAPLLADLVWRVYLQTESDQFLREAYPKLLEFFRAWFRKRRDSDADGVPEWQSVLQTGYPDSPSFVGWSPWAECVEVSSVESPDLIGCLLHDCQSLMLIAEKLGRSEDLPDMETKATGLRRSLARAWSDDEGCYLPVDRDLHVSLSGKKLGRGKGNFKIKVAKKFDPRVRLVVRCQGPEAEAKKVAVTIHGRGPRGQFRKERLEGHDFHWFWSFGSATTSNTFASIDRIEIVGSTKTFDTEIRIVDHHRLDASWLLPLWDGTDQVSRLEGLLEVLLSDRFWRPHGISMLPTDDPVYGERKQFSSWGVRVDFNERLTQGLVNLGKRQEAAELVKRLMTAITATLAAGGTFREFYHPDELGGEGLQDSAFGLAPLDLFLKVLGVGLRSPWSVQLEGSNPFSWPITLRWRGLAVHRPVDGFGWVQFPDGERVQIDTPGRQRIERIR